ncbi:hypothetical protein I3843_09G123600 [Carya illinoinensis]|uniref:Uncharacterized protein n=1 Tax=Carya illinoinensis TaxID=32201 RepID=A0A922E5R3_CARIL|nr:hypothetical protein I3842_09G126100 [Carya illinoinensis]KAG7963551.1 hypothetical protein I3843_09G123600 [Carya illinoinensis]
MRLGCDLGSSVTTPKRFAWDHTFTRLMEGQDSHIASLLEFLGSDHDTQRATMEATGRAQTMCAGLRMPLSVHLRACMCAPAPLNEASGVPLQACQPAHDFSPCLGAP